LTADQKHHKFPEKNGPLSGKNGYLAGLPLSVRVRIESAYQAHALGHGVPLSRDTRPDGSDRRGLFSEWTYRLLEASFTVEDEIDHELGNVPPSKRHVVDELRRRRNLWLDEIGENETAGRRPARRPAATALDAGAA
jgi:hypothetical protein